MTQQLDLFDTRAGRTGEVVAFPADRLRGFILETVATIRAKPASKREWHFRHNIGRVWTYLTIAGVARHEVELEVKRFAEAVATELRRQAVIAKLHGLDDEDVA
ncbi:DUF6074 family protein [Bradyrhizobium sp. Arg314]